MSGQATRFFFLMTLAIPADGGEGRQTFQGTLDLLPGQSLSALYRHIISNPAIIPTEWAAGSVMAFYVAPDELVPAPVPSHRTGAMS
ncbi:hypothetical protein ACIBF1_44235 [Spirillospora sp. NPDC050679]